jgi:quinol monooxygenase YgiN
MAQIVADRELVTLVVSFDIDPAKVDEKVQHLVDIAHEHSKRPGFVSCSIHKSLDHTKLVEYIQWESPEAFQAVFETFQGGSPHPENFALSHSVATLKVVEVVGPSAA